MEVLPIVAHVGKLVEHVAEFGLDFTHLQTDDVVQPSEAEEDDEDAAAPAVDEPGHGPDEAEDSRPLQVLIVLDAVDQACDTLLQYTEHVPESVFATFRPMVLNLVLDLFGKLQKQFERNPRGSAWVVDLSGK